jgi:hypothetical protein
MEVYKTVVVHYICLLHYTFFATDHYWSYPPFLNMPWKILVVKPEGKRLLWGCKYRWKDIIKLDVWEIEEWRYELDSTRSWTNVMVSFCRYADKHLRTIKAENSLVMWIMMEDLVPSSWWIGPVVSSTADCCTDSNTELQNKQQISAYRGSMTSCFRLFFLLTGVFFCFKSKTLNSSVPAIKHTLHKKRHQLHRARIS